MDTRATNHDLEQESQASESARCDVPDVSGLPPETRHLLELMLESEDQSIDAQKDVTRALEHLAHELERRALPIAEAVDPDGLLPAHSTDACLDLLRAALTAVPPVIAPELDPTAPLGHVYPLAQERLGAGVELSIKVLEELANLGLLQRSLANRVHVCPACERCQINFLERCTSCGSIDLGIESLLHHFRCGHTDIESSFRADGKFECPKCDHALRQVGRDFDRPSETYVCADCSTLLEEPRLTGQCLACGHEFASHEARQASIHSYAPTPLAVRAIELRRLAGLDVDAVLYDADLQIATSDFLAFEVRREIARANRHGLPFTTAILSFEVRREPVAIFSEWPSSTVRSLCSLIASSLRTLDLVTRLDETRFGILMPMSEASGADAFRDRVFGIFESSPLDGLTGERPVPVWQAVTWDSPDALYEDVRAFFHPGVEGPEE